MKGCRVSSTIFYTSAVSTFKRLLIPLELAFDVFSTESQQTYVFQLRATAPVPLYFSLKNPGVLEMYFVIRLKQSPWTQVPPLNMHLRNSELCNSQAHLGNILLSKLLLSSQLEYVLQRNRQYHTCAISIHLDILKYHSDIKKIYAIIVKLEHPPNGETNNDRHIHL